MCVSLDHAGVCNCRICLSAYLLCPAHGDGYMLHPQASRTRDVEVNEGSGMVQI